MLADVAIYYDKESMLQPDLKGGGIKASTPWEDLIAAHTSMPSSGWPVPSRKGIFLTESYECEFCSNSGKYRAVMCLMCSWTSHIFCWICLTSISAIRVSDPWQVSSSQVPDTRYDLARKLAPVTSCRQGFHC